MNNDTQPALAFIGGGNMAGAIVGGLINSGWPATAITVVEPVDAQRERLRHSHPDLTLIARADAQLAQAQLVLWAVKPQSFAEAAAPCRAHIAKALQLSVMAGVRCAAIEAATGSRHVVRAMPNTPALIGQGIAGLYAQAGVSSEQRALVERVLQPTGSLLWVEREELLDAVTALSGSGPAYVFYFIEAMVEAGVAMGLTAEQARQLAQQTFAGAATLAMQSSEPPAVLRERVTSKGGTTHAAISSLESDAVKAAFVRALHAARQRAEELGQA